MRVSLCGPKFLHLVARSLFEVHEEIAVLRSAHGRISNVVMACCFATCGRSNIRHLVYLDWEVFDKAACQAVCKQQCCC